MQKILYLPIETIAREFDARMLLAHQALSRGYSVILGQKNNVFKAAERLEYGIYFYKSHGVENFPKNQKTGKSGFKYISLDEEGLIFVDDAHYLRNSKPHKLDHLDIVFTWGSYQRDLLVKENPDLKEKTIPVGNPRFDLLRAEFRSLYDNASKAICKKWGRYVLINTRFVPGNFSRLYGCSYIESRVHQYRTIIGREPLPEEKKYLVDEEKYYIEMFKHYTDMLSMLSSRFPDINFILRPHPSEDILNWEDSLKGLNNVNAIFEGSAIDWITGALAVIHTGCTTGIEAWALNKPVIAFNPIDKDGIEPTLPNEFGVKIKFMDDLPSLMEDIVSGKFKNNASEEELRIARRFIESIDGDYSTNRFLDSLEGLQDNINYKSKDDKSSVYLKLKDMERIKSAIKFKILKFLSKYQPLITKVSGKKISGFIYGYFKKYPGLFAQFQKFPELKHKEIKARLSSYDYIFAKKLEKKPHNDYQIKKIATDTYLINVNTQELSRERS